MSIIRAFPKCGLVAIPSIKQPQLPPCMRDVVRVALLLAASLVVQALLAFFSSYSFNKVGEMTALYEIARFRG